MARNDIFRSYSYSCHTCGAMGNVVTQNEKLTACPDCGNRSGTFHVTLHETVVGIKKDK